MPPTMTPTQIGSRIQASVAKPMRLSLESANPALLNAVTE